MTPNIERLTKCLEANEKADPKLFDIRTYRTRTPCGTVHCLVGNYIASNPGCGLELVRYDSWHDGIGRSNTVITEREGQRQALAEHFGISTDDTAYLFHHANEPQALATSLSYRLIRLRAFIDEHKPTALALDFKPLSALEPALT